MSKEIADHLKTAPVVPLVGGDDPAVAIETVKALQAGGLNVIEVVLRSDGALQVMGELVKACPDAIVGAGTVLTPSQASACVDLGAKFIVSPGLNEDIAKLCMGSGLPFFPGTVTATEIQWAYNLGLHTVKFFPASLAGGPKMLKAFGSVFRDMTFMPTGGVSPDNLADYLDISAVIACGGSWLTPKDAIQAGDFGKITELAAEAVAIAAKVRP